MAQHGGVVQYDLAKSTDDDIVLKGFLWSLSKILRSAVNIMRSDQRISPSKIPEFMSFMFKKSDNLRDSY